MEESEVGLGQSAHVAEGNLSSDGSLWRDIALVVIGFVLGIIGKLVDQAIRNRREARIVRNEVADLEKWASEAVTAYSRSWAALRDFALAKRRGDDPRTPIQFNFYDPMTLLALSENLGVVARSKDRAFRGWTRRCIDKHKKCADDYQALVSKNSTGLRTMGWPEAESWVNLYSEAAINAALLRWNAKKLRTATHNDIPEINDWGEMAAYINGILEETETELEVELPRR